MSASLALLFAVALTWLALDVLRAEAVTAVSPECAGDDVVSVGGMVFCSHGPDPAPPGVDVGVRAEPVIGGSQAPTPVTCEGDGVTGLRVQVLYAHAADVPSRFPALLGSMRQWAADADGVVRASAAETGGARAVRFVTSRPALGACAVSVLEVRLSASGDDDFGQTARELAALGFDRTDRKYLVFVDATAICGQAGIVQDHRRQAANQNNRGPSYARVDAGCWADGRTAAHELAHTLGAVQHNAPNASRGFHCVDEWDVMCYSDWPYAPEMRIDCPVQDGDARLDCNHDDYFHTDPAAGSYLDLYWNVASNRFLIGAVDRPPVTAPVNDRLDRPLRLDGDWFADLQNVTYATTAADDPTPSCLRGGRGGGKRSVWYEIVPASAGALTLSTAGSDYDTLVAVYADGSTGLSELACNDDEGASSMMSRLSVEVEAGVPLRVQVLSGSGAYAPFTLRITGEISPLPAELKLDRPSARFNGIVTATMSRFTPGSPVTLRWDGGMVVATATAGPGGVATARFRAPLSAFGTHTLTASAADGTSAEASLRTIPRVSLNEPSGTTSERLRVYLYGFAAGERVEVRWHAGGTTATRFVVLKTLVVGANGRASAVVSIPSGAAAGRHLVVGKVVGVGRSASTPFELRVDGGSVADPSLTPSPTPTPTPTPSPTQAADGGATGDDVDQATPAATGTAAANPTATASTRPTQTSVPITTVTPTNVPTETPTPHPTETATPSSTAYPTPSPMLPTPAIETPPAGVGVPDAGEDAPLG